MSDILARNQANNENINEIAISPMSNSMTMMLIYHGYPKTEEKPDTKCHQALLKNRLR